MDYEEDNRHTKFLDWAAQHGVLVHGIKPAKFPCKGLGVIAEQPVKHGDRVIFVPSQTILTVNPMLTKPERQLPSGISIHGRLAVGITFPEHESAIVQWKAVMPSEAEFRSLMPVCWSSTFQNLLPTAAQELVQKQHQKFNADLCLLSESFLPAIAEETGQTIRQLQERYTHGWLIVNTRCFYWDYPVLQTGGLSELLHGSTRKTSRRPKMKKLPRDDCMALCPVADYFNHADVEGCCVTFNAEGFAVIADRDYDIGEELTISYGRHSNDFLLVEYGFTMPANSSDFALLDDYIIPRLSDDMKQYLTSENLLGKYSLALSDSFATCVCHRTQCALRALQITPSRLRKFVSGASDGQKEQNMIDGALIVILQKFLIDIEHNIRHVEQQGDGGTIVAQDSLRTRWLQIHDMVKEVLALAP